MFRDRKDAGQKLAVALKKYEKDNPLILAIPRGGIEVAYYVAQHLNAQMVPVVIRKLPLPYSPEAGFGAIAEDGSKIILDYVATSVKPEVIEITTIEAGQHSDAKHFHVVALVSCGCLHDRTIAMHRDETRAAIFKLPHSRSHCCRNIEKLEIRENFLVPLQQPLH